MVVCSVSLMVEMMAVLRAVKLAAWLETEMAKKKVEMLGFFEAVMLAE